VPGVDDALRRYGSKEAPPAARARARIEELAPSVAADAWSRRQPLTDGPSSGAIDRYIPEDVRAILEERFWHAVEESSTLEAVSADGSFAAAPEEHPALFADHGIVHARDVAAGVLELAGVANGLLLPPRPADRREFVAGLAILLAYIHDVGMNDPTPEGRRIHALHAAQIPFTGAMDDVLARLWDSGGPVVSRIRSASAVAPFRVADDVVLRELTSLAVGHSKSTMPAALHADFPGLRKVLQSAILVELEDHRRAANLNPNGNLPPRLGANARWYAEPARDAFAWLDSPDSAHRALADDAVDAVRLLRAADALRQRGTTLRTTAGYEIFIDVETGRAVFSLRTSVGNRLFLLRVDSPFSAGEANVRKAVVTPNGDLRISFHRGRFSSPTAEAAACDATARVVADIGSDVLGAFEVRRPSPDLPPPRRDPRGMRVELERPADEPAFAERVGEAAARSDPLLLERVFVVADLENASSAERARYFEGIPIAAESEEAGEILDALGDHGMRVAAIDRRQAFEDVRRVRVAQGEMLVEAGSPPAFVYIAFECTLRIEQLGGHPDIDVPPWIPIGVTGVVRRAERNSRVVAAEPGEVLMIPGELFAREWFRPYEKSEIADVLAQVAR
jgi:hypothetical protein